MLFRSEIGRAYPCFCTREELDELRKNQEEKKMRTGYYGRYARCRNISVDTAIERIKNGEPYVIRFKSEGDFNNKIIFEDLTKGKLSLSENDTDDVIMKSDSMLPTYHFAHVVDDHLMHTTHVVRGEEWLPSVTKHIEMFRALGLKPPKYIHTPLIMKQDGDIKRKISKRKDPEASANYYKEIGIPVEAVKEYLLNIANSNFEIWRKQNPDKSVDEFDFKLNKMGVSGALFDMVKLLDVSKNVISRYSAEYIYENVKAWADIYDEELAEMLNNKEYSLKIFGIERGNKKPRKDISKWSEVKDNIVYMYNNKFENNSEFLFGKIEDLNEISKIVKLYIEKYYNESDDKQTWFDKIKDLAEEVRICKRSKRIQKRTRKMARTCRRY